MLLHQPLVVKAIMIKQIRNSTTFFTYSWVNTVVGDIANIIDTNLPTRIDIYADGAIHLIQTNDTSDSDDYQSYVINGMDEEELAWAVTQHPELLHILHEPSTKLINLHNMIWVI